MSNGYVCLKMVCFFIMCRREQWHLFSSYASWQHLVAQTKRQARDHAILSDIYANTVFQRLGQVTDEVKRIYQRVSPALNSNITRAFNEAIKRRIPSNLRQTCDYGLPRASCVRSLSLFHRSYYLPPLPAPKHQTPLKVPFQITMRCLEITLLLLMLLLCLRTTWFFLYPFRFP